MLKQRIPSGLLLTTVLLLVIWADNALGRTALQPGLVMLGLFVVGIGFASVELASLLRAKWGHCSALTLWLSGVTGCLLTYLLPMLQTPRTGVAVFATGVVTVLFTAMFKHSFTKKQTHGGGAAGASAMLALVYLGVLPGMYLLIRLADWSAWVIAAVLLVVKACDIGAYFAGRLLGRHKLIPWLSPAKTWEGLIAGMIFAGLCAVMFTAWGNTFAPTARSIAPWYAFLAGLVLGLLGQVGDLVASLLKRDAGVKDYARTIPGFGGVMDVADSLLLVSPVAYWLLMLAPPTGG